VLSDFFIAQFVCIVCVLLTRVTTNGCAILGGYEPLEVARQREVATDLTFLMDLAFFVCFLFLLVREWSFVFYPILLLSFYF
jgi:preprotein translocase subunit SecG